MQNVMSIWASLSIRRRIAVAGVTLAVFLAILGLARMGGAPEMALLYAGLDGRAAGEVIAALDARGVAYAVRGDSIHVDAASRDALRMALAGEGLPAAGGQGYELLDSLSGFGTTSQMFDAAYWRAKEGELARTILAVPGVRAARVHVAPGPSDPLRRDLRPSASITLTTADGSLDADRARALRHLVAAAVPGMRPEDVQVIDTVAGLIVAPEDGAATGRAASDRAAELRHRVERLLAARVGPGRAVVEVAVDLVTEAEQVSERRIDPQGRVAISSDTQESSRSASDPAADVTVASNLPEGDAGAKGAGQSRSSETRERVNYESSETRRDLTRAPGGVRRLTVAVLVDGIVAPDATGTPVWAPRGDEELAALRELVAAAVGIDEGRGDVLTLKSLEFQPLPLEGTEAQDSLLPALGPIDAMALIRIAALSVVALVLGLFVLRPILLSRRIEAPAGLPLALPAAGPALTGEIDDGFPGAALAALGAGTDPEAEDPASRLRRLIAEREAESIEILRGWLEPEEGAA